MKKYWFCERPAIMDEAANAQRKFHPVLVVAVYLFLPGMMNVLLGLAEQALTDPLGLSLGHENYQAVSQILYNVIRLVPFALIVFFVRFAERRSWASMGIVNNNALKTYLIVLSLFFVLSVLFAFVRPDSMQKGSLLTALQFASQATVSLGGAIITYGFLAVSLANRISMKSAVITILLMTLAIYVLQMISVAIVNSQIYAPEMEGPSPVSLIAKIFLLAVESTIFMAACALLLFRTGHIWSVAMLAFFETCIERLGLMLDYPYHNIIMIILSAAALCMVLFMPKKERGTDNDLTEGAGFVSR